MYHRTQSEIKFRPTSRSSPFDLCLCRNLGTDFVRFCLSLRYSVTRDQILHDDVIARAYPDFADIRFAAGFPTPAPREGWVSVSTIQEILTWRRSG